jgi:hypothetical protein
MEMIEIQTFKKAAAGVHPNDPIRLDIYQISTKNQKVDWLFIAENKSRHV